MAFINAGPSPVWLGVFAIVSFGGLVVAAFASGYHLASAPSLSQRAAPGVSTTGHGMSPGASEEAAAFAPVAGRVAEPLVDRERSVLRAQPDDGEVLDELPAGRAVSISRESGDWLFIRYERDGQEREGWAHRVNIEREEP